MNFLSLATMKASASFENMDRCFNFSVMDEILKEAVDDDKDGLDEEREKVRQFRLQRKNTKNSQDVEKDWGGVCCYLFKESQYGGLREIYVLTFRSRLIQLFIETYFRVLCSKSDFATMTHPQSKLSLIDDHQSKIVDEAVRIGGKIMSRVSSEDKQKWSQNNNVNMYMFLSAQFFPEPHARMLMKCISMWRHKSLMIPIKNHGRWSQIG